MRIRLHSWNYLFLPSTIMFISSSNHFVFQTKSLISFRYINTLAAAELLYDALYQWNKIGSITIDSTSLAFFQDFSSSVTAGTYSSSSSTYSALTTAIKNYADGYMSIVEKYTPTGGALGEQFDRDTGSPLSAVDLTWSCKSNSYRKCICELIVLRRCFIFDCRNGS